MSDRVIEAKASAELEGLARRFVDMAQPRLGSRMVAVNDDLFAPVAGLRVFGAVHCARSERDPEEEIDLAALANGGRAIARSGAHFGVPANLLAPGRGRDMGDGRETRRRREPGKDR